MRTKQKTKPKTYTKEILIEKLKEYHEEFGKVPNTDDIMKNSDYPSPTTYMLYFGTWKKALKAADMELPKKFTYTEEQLIDILKNFDKKPTIKMMGGVLPSSNTYILRFGSWKNALERAGYTNES